MTRFELPQLPYAPDALEPVMFQKKGATLFGSGWVWLSTDK